jgi:hypothetical protein
MHTDIFIKSIFRLISYILNYGIEINQLKKYMQLYFTRNSLFRYMSKVNYHLQHC